MCLFFWFDVEKKLDVFVINTYIDIISGKNEVVNMICDKLNTSIDNGCSFKTYERCQCEDMCVNNNTFILTFNNFDMTSDKMFTKYNKFVGFELKICVCENELKYYSVSSDKTDTEFSKDLLENFGLADKN